MKKRLIYFMICLLGSGITAQAQYTYTLKQCLEEGLANNYSLRITRVAVTDGHAAVGLDLVVADSLEVHGDAQRGADLVLSREST